MLGETDRERLAYLSVALECSSGSAIRSALRHAYELERRRAKEGRQNEGREAGVEEGEAE